MAKVCLVAWVGFNEEDPDHVYVADFLNSMGRGKGQYIVKAIMAYQNPDGVATGRVGVPTVDYEKIRTFVLQVLEDRGNVGIPSSVKDTEQSKVQRKVREIHSECEEFPELDEMAVNDILASLSVFR